MFSTHCFRYKYPLSVLVCKYFRDTVYNIHVLCLSWNEPSFLVVYCSLTDTLQHMENFVYFPPFPWNMANVERFEGRANHSIKCCSSLRDVSFPKTCVTDLKLNNVYILKVK